MMRQARFLSHSRLIRVFRIALPLAALVLVAVVFMPDDFVTLESGRNVNECRTLKDWAYVGKTRDGATLEISGTDTCRTGDWIRAGNVFASVTNSGVVEYEASATTAEYEMNTSFMDLNGAVTLTRADEFEVEADEFRLFFDDAEMESRGNVQFRFAGGEGRAGRMRITARRPGESGATPWSIIEFSNGVEIRYRRPNKTEM